MNVNPYESPLVTAAEMAPSDSNALPLHRSFRLTSGSHEKIGTLREAFCFAIVQHTGILLFTGISFGGERLYHCALIAVIPFWSFVLTTFIRRATNPTTVDIVLVKYGIWLMMGLVALVGIILDRV